MTKMVNFGWGKAIINPKRTTSNKKIKSWYGKKKERTKFQFMIIYYHELNREKLPFLNKKFSNFQNFQILKILAVRDKKLAPSQALARFF